MARRPFTRDLPWPPLEGGNILRIARIRLLNVLSLTTAQLRTSSARLCFSTNFSARPVQALLGLLGPLALLSVPCLVARTGLLRPIALVEVLLLDLVLGDQAATMG